MYLEKIKINKFRVLQDLEVKFQVPKSATADPNTGNIVNVVAGVNGTGKTSLLEAIYLAISDPKTFLYLNSVGSDFTINDFGEVNSLNRAEWFIKKNNRLENENKDKITFYDVPRLIFLPSQQSFQYSPVSELVNAYSFSQKIDVNSILGKAEFYIKEYVLSFALESNVADPQQRMKAAVNSFNKNFLDANLLTRLVGLSKEQFNKPIFENASGNKVTIDQLSDGEKQLYGRVISLMILQPNNSIILIDEPEISLHPAWQQKIMQIYSRIGTNNQFIVATHSPQIIASVPYQNRIILRKHNSKIEPLYYSEPPSGVDVNSILAEIMGADPRPPEILDLYRQYRKLVEECKENTPEAQKIREQLSVESEHSSFMQEMAFLIELRDAA